ncbi:MAG TPA: DegT/DnrJ/EryC1/StrS family aminotransferase [Acidimicrobiia bacterium]|nr:DegT/DnrJ/EryC1/StrS family aminotransferase [Acidimicrobiia bacterium]
MTDWRVPLFDTDFGRDELEAVQRPVKAGWLTMGQEVIDLEEEMRSMTGAKHVIAVSNATLALQLSSVALGLGPGDEVLCPSLTFVASASAPRSVGANIRFCDSVGSHDLNIDPDSIQQQITDRTRAIVVVHYAGFACDMETINQLAADRGIVVIEDAAHAVFTKYREKNLGLHGQVGCYSFYSNKNATSGEGGAIVTDDDELAAKLRLLRSHGMTTPTLDRHKGRAYSYDVVMAGFNARMDEIRAALLRVQLTKLPSYLERRRQVFSLYCHLFEDTPVEVPFSRGRYREDLHQTAVHVMSVLLPPGTNRDAVMSSLKEARIQSSIHYPPIHRFSAYRDLGQSLPRTEALADRQLTLPLYPGMADDDVEAVVKELLASLGRR